MKGHQTTPKAAKVALAAAVLGVLASEPASGQNFKPQLQKPQNLKPSLDQKSVSLTINNPNKFKVQIKQGQTWKNAGSATRITKRFTLPNAVGSSMTVRVRIGEGQNKFHHTAPNSFFGEMYEARTYSARLGFNGIESRGLSIDCSGRRCGRVAETWQAVNRNSVTLNLAPEPLKVAAKLGVGQLSFQPEPEVIQMCGSSYLPWFGGSVNGQRANGTSSKIQLTNFSKTNPMPSLTRWCSRNALGQSGFITKALKYSDVAIAAYTPNQAITQTTTGKLQRKTIWNPSSTFKVLVKDGTRFRTTGTNNGQHDLNLLKSLFTDSDKSLFVIRSITPSGQALSHSVADFSGVINQLNATTGTIVGCNNADKPSKWCGRIGEYTTFEIPVDEGKIGIPLFNPPIYATTMESPMNLSIQNASVFMPSRGIMKLRLQFKTTAIRGEVLAKGVKDDWDPDYRISAGTFTFEVPFSIATSGNSLVVTQTEDCDSGDYCLKDVSGFRLTIPNYPFVGGVEKENTTKMQKQFKQRVGAQLQAALRGLDGKSFALAPAIPGVGNANPMKDLLGVQSEITNDLSISANKLRLRYRPQATFVTPELLDSISPTYEIPNLAL